MRADDLLTQVTVLTPKDSSQKKSKSTWTSRTRVDGSDSLSMTVLYSLESYFQLMKQLFFIYATEHKKTFLVFWW